MHLGEGVAAPDGMDTASGDELGSESDDKTRKTSGEWTEDVLRRMYCTA